MSKFFGKYPSLARYLCTGLAAYTAYDSFFYVKKHEKCIIFNRLRGTCPKVYEHGPHMKVPCVDKVIRYQMWPTTDSFVAHCISRDMQQVTMAIVLRSRPDLDLGRFYTLYGVKYRALLLPSIVLPCTKDTVAQYSSMELLEKSKVFEKDLKEAIIEKGSKLGVIIEEVCLSCATFDGWLYKRALEEKETMKKEAESAHVIQKAELQKKLLLHDARSFLLEAHHFHKLLTCLLRVQAEHRKNDHIADGQ